MRTTINIPDDLIKEAEALYKTKSRSQAVESALTDAIRFKKARMLMGLKSKISFDEESVKDLRRAEIDETEHNR